MILDQLLTRKPGRRRGLFLLLMVACGCLAGCGPQSDLHGRWFNGDLSLRFLPDGHVLMNSRATGLVRGVYLYEPLPSSASASAELQPNLQLFFADRQINLQAIHVGSQRLNITEIAANSRRNPLRAKQILKKAPPEEERSMQLEERRPLVSASGSNT